MPKPPPWHDTRKTADVPLVRPTRFEEWLDVFFRPYDGFESPWTRYPPGGEEPPEFSAAGEEIVELFTYTMLASSSELANLSDSQLGNGLDNLLNTNLYDIAHTVRTAKVSEDARCAAISAIKHLYLYCLTQRAPPVLGHLNEEAAGCARLQYITFMLWDVSPLSCGSVETWPAILEVMQSALYSPNPAVIESGLHGLGHSVYDAGGPAVAIIDAFVRQRRGQVRDELIQYALQARTGMIQ